MADGTAKPVIFISYSHKDEPQHPRDGEVQWLSFVRTYLQPAIKFGIFDLFVDEHLSGGADLKPEIERKLRACDVFVLLISANSTASDYIVDTEILVTRDRQAKGEDVCFYPVLLTPTPKVALDKFKDKVIRPHDAKPLSSFPYGERIQKMTEIADEIAEIAAKIVSLKPEPPKRGPQPSYVHISGLPETPYERLVGRDDELKRLDDAWADNKTNILSLIAEGGAGKSALVNEWLKRLQTDNYRGAEAVLGWSFYSQGTKERATSADQFLNWALDKLGINLETTSTAAKGEAIAEAMMHRRVLLVLDGVEPLQHGLDTQLGQLKDQGLRALLRRFAATPPAQAHGLIVLSSRLAVADIARWRDGAAPIVDVDRLSDEAGAALLRDNGVWGADTELKIATHDFGGHALALGLLASFLKETQIGDVRRRDHIRGYFADPDNPRHDHARRVMESYEKEWLSTQPVLLAIMRLVGLFDRPASGGCLQALRKKPVIKGLTEDIVRLKENEWQRAVTRLRDAHLLVPADPSAPDTLDSHPLIREWFGEQLRNTNEAAWCSAHFVIYDYLRRTTREGEQPTLEKLVPLYQAIRHGCLAEEYRDAFTRIYVNRISRIRQNGNLEFYAIKKLGASATDLAAVSWFFSLPYVAPVESLPVREQTWAVNLAAGCLRGTGRFEECLGAEQLAIEMNTKIEDWSNVAIRASDHAITELILGNVHSAITAGEEAVRIAMTRGAEFHKMLALSSLAQALFCAGRLRDAEERFVQADKIQAHFQPKRFFLYSLSGFWFCSFLLERGDCINCTTRAEKILKWEDETSPLLDQGLARTTLARCELFTYSSKIGLVEDFQTKRVPYSRFDQAVQILRSTGYVEFAPIGLIARAAFHRSIGDWDGASRDLNEVEEIAEPGPMRLYLCDLSLERARLAFARIEAFAPLNAMLDKGNPSSPDVPNVEEIAELKGEAEKQLKIATDYIETCGYHRRDEELAELRAILRGEKKFADLPPRV
jgi:tetratricopeptide (TPR) repeat protein